MLSIFFNLVNVEFRLVILNSFWWLVLQWQRIVWTAWGNIADNVRVWINWVKNTSLLSKFLSLLSYDIFILSCMTNYLILWYRLMLRFNLFKFFYSLPFNFFNLFISVLLLKFNKQLGFLGYLLGLLYHPLLRYVSLFNSILDLLLNFLPPFVLLHDLCCLLFFYLPLPLFQLFVQLFLFLLHHFEPPSFSLLLLLVQLRYQVFAILCLLQVYSDFRLLRLFCWLRRWVYWVLGWRHSGCWVHQYSILDVLL